MTIYLLIERHDNVSRNLQVLLLHSIIVLADKTTTLKYKCTVTVQVKNTILLCEISYLQKTYYDSINVGVPSNGANYNYYQDTSGKLPKTIGQTTAYQDLCHYSLYTSKHEGESRANIAMLFMTTHKYIIYQNRYSSRLIN